MLGAVVGDIAGSTYERENCKVYDRIEIFRRRSRSTDDSILTVATADHFLSGKSYTQVYQEWGLEFRGAGYGKTFYNWIGSANPQPYNSWGNGSAMRVSPVAWVADDLDWAMAEAKRSAEVTHNHPEGIKGAQAVTAAIYLARTGESKDRIRARVEGMFGYNLRRTIDSIRPDYHFQVSCQRSVPEAIIAFLDSHDFEDAIRKAISLGGDSDTIACIAGSIAHAFYGTIPPWMVEYCRGELQKSQLEILDEFCKQYSVGY
jgi:ADP-ribosylglycohydrolase